MLHATNLRFRVRTLMLVVAVLSLALSYGASYYRLSRRGLVEAVPYGMPGFLYVPCVEPLTKEDLSRHYALATFYAPLNWLDRALFRADAYPADCVMVLSG